MAEYIEREKLSFHLASEIENCGEDDSSHRPIAYGSMLGLKTALSYVNTLPSADVVKVVRCKDCKHRTNKGICEKFRQRYPFFPEDDFFCGFGELKECEGK
jgi:hypothetical protein